MENFFSAVPFGGLALLMLASYRLAAIALRFKSKNYFSDLARFLWTQISLFIRQEYRSVSVFLLSTGIYFMYRGFVPQPALPWYLPVITGGTASVAALFITSWLRQTYLLSKTPARTMRFFMLMNEGRGLSNGWGLLFYMSALLFLLWFYPVRQAADLVFLGAGLGIGGGGMVLFALFTDARAFDNQGTASLDAFRIHHFDTRLILTAATVLITTTFSQSPALLLFPVLLSLAGMLSSALCKALAGVSAYFRSYRLISALLLSVMAIYLIYSLFPEFIRTEGHEYFSIHILAALLTGIWSSWITGKVIFLHEAVLNAFNRFAERRFPDYQWLHRLTKLGLKSSATLGVLTVLALCSGLAWVAGGLYGLLVAFTALFSLDNGK